MKPTQANLSDLLDSYLGANDQKMGTVHLVGPMAAALPRDLTSKDKVIFVDGGVIHKTTFGIAAGDGDSGPLELLDFVFPQEKDRSDLGLILDSLKGKTKCVVLHGFSSGRFDHYVFNLGELHQFLSEAKAPVCVRMDANLAHLSSGEWEFKLHSEFSLGAVETCQILLSGDCKYATRGPIELPPLSSRGLSNVATGTVRVRSNRPVFIIANFTSGWPNFIATDSR